MNPIEKISGIYPLSRQLDGNHKSLTQIMQPYANQSQVYLYYACCKGSSVLRHTINEDKLCCMASL